MVSKQNTLWVTSNDIILYMVSKQNTLWVTSNDIILYIMSKQNTLWVTSNNIILYMMSKQNTLWVISNTLYTWCQNKIHFESLATLFILWCQNKIHFESFTTLSIHGIKVSSNLRCSAIALKAIEASTYWSEFGCEGSQGWGFCGFLGGHPMQDFEWAYISNTWLHAILI